MSKILAEFQVSLSDACDSAQCAIEYGRQLSAQMMIIGCLGRVGETYSLTLRLVDVETGGVIAVVEERAKIGPDDLFNLVDLCGAKLMDEYAAIQYQQSGEALPALPDRVLQQNASLPHNPPKDSAFLNLQIFPTNAIVLINGKRHPNSGIVPVPSKQPVDIRIEADGCFPNVSTYTLDPNETLLMEVGLKRSW